MQIIIPPYLLIFSIIAMVILHILLPFQSVFNSPINYTGIFCIVVGVAIVKKIRDNISTENTEIHTFKLPRKFLTGGLFQYSRNPIYLGFTIILLGLNILLGSLSPFIIVIAFVLITNFWYIPYEEKNMLKQFDQEYKNYKKKVRRWI